MNTAMTPIGITLFRRPEYTKMILDALGQCYGVGDRQILISIDHDNFYRNEIAQVRDLALAFADHCPRVSVTMQVASLGIDVHKEWLIACLLNVADRFIFLEDDTLPAKDWLRFMDWALVTYQDQPAVMSVCGYRKVAALDKTRLGDCYLQPNFVPWGWGMWADRWHDGWQDGRPYRDDCEEWFGDPDPNGHFDYWWKRRAETQNLSTVFPVVPRIHNLGREHGEHTIPKIFDETDFNPIGAWQINQLPDRREWIAGDA